MIEYRGFKVERIKATHVFSEIVKGRLHERRRKFEGWQASYPDSGGSKVFHTLQELRGYIDCYMKGEHR